MSMLYKLFAVAFIAGLAAARVTPPLRSDISLEARLASGTLSDCWSALTELRSCTNEIVLFLLNGESYLSLGCCRAIRLITHSCWPGMLTPLGFTAEEADILRGYCDAETAAPPTPGGVSGTTPLPPAAPVAPINV